MRPFICAANWKLHKSPRETREFFQNFQTLNQEHKPSLDQSQSRSSLGRVRQAIFFVPAISLEAACENRGDYEIGLQNAYFEMSGAFTGENSISAAKELGVTWLLVGHSERRTLFRESGDILTRKVEAGLRSGMKVMLCVGETLTERESQKTMSVVEKQIVEGLSQESLKLILQKPQLLALAYEPVWAIGTGKVATPEQASEVHLFLREILSGRLGQISKEGTSLAATEIPILYGGSVKPENAKLLGGMPGIDGFLVGGASLVADQFQAIIDA